MSALSSVRVNPFHQLASLNQMGVNLKCIMPISAALLVIVNTPQTAAVNTNGLYTPPAMVPWLVYSCMAACYLTIDNALAQVACCAACVFTANVGVNLFH